MNMTAERPTSEEIIISGCAVKIRYADASDSTVIPNMKQILFGQHDIPNAKIQKI